jgi:transcriptional regulator with XRE-family HTH domain
VNVSLNGRLVRERRTAMGWSVPELARRLGVQASVGWAIERGSLQALRQLPLGALIDLSDTLDLDPAELFAATDARPREPKPDAMVIEAVLLRYRDGLTRETLASGLGWPPDRLDRALEALADNAATAGWRLRRVPGYRYRVEARRSALSVHQWRRLAQAAASTGRADEPLSIQAATLLHRLLYRGRPVASESCGQDDPSVLDLLRQELIEDVGGRFGAVAEVTYSQGLIEAERLGCR